MGMEEKTTPDFNLDINLDIQLKRYPVDNLNNNIDIVNKNGGMLPINHKMDLYVCKLDKNVKIAYLSLPKCASNEIRDIFNNLTNTKPRNLKRLEINIKDKNDPRIKNMIIFSFIRT